MTDVPKITSADAAASSQSSAAARRAKKNQPQEQQVVVQITEEPEKDLNQGVTIEHTEVVIAEDDGANSQARAAANQLEIAEMNAIKEQVTIPAQPEIVEEAPTTPTTPTEPPVPGAQDVTTSDNASEAQGNAAARRAAKNQPAQPEVVEEAPTAPAQPVVAEETPAQPEVVIQQEVQPEIVEEAPTTPTTPTEPPVPGAQDVTTSDNASEAQGNAAARRAAKNQPAQPEVVIQQEVQPEVVADTPVAPAPAPAPAQPAPAQPAQPPVLGPRDESTAESAANSQGSAVARRNAKKNPPAPAPDPTAPAAPAPTAQAPAPTAPAPVQPVPVQPGPTEPAQPVPVQPGPTAPATAPTQPAQPSQDEINTQIEELRNQLAEAERRAAEAEQRAAAAEQQPEQPEQPVVETEEDRPRPAAGYEYLMDKSTKDLKKLIRTSKDPKVVENAKLELEGRKHDKQVWTPKELSDNERAIVDAAVAASGSDKPFYKNLKAQRILRRDLRAKNEKVVAELDRKIEAAETEEEKEALQIFRDAFADKNISRKYARTLVKDLKIGDRVEHTVVVDSYKDKREAKDKLGDEAGDYRIRRHSKRYMKHNAQVQAAMSDAERAGEPISSHQAVYEQISGNEDDPRRISGDRTFETSEITTAASYASDDKTRYNAARNELKKLGYKVDDGMAKKIIMPIVAAVATAGGAGAGILFTGGLKTVAESTAWALAEASAELFTESGQLIVGAYDSERVDVSAKVEVNNWQNALISAGTAALLAAAMFDGPEEEIDLLRNHDRCDLFRDVSDGNGGTTRAFEQASFGNKAKTKATKAILREIDNLDLTDEQKVALLNQAAGNKGLGKITGKELILAYLHGLDMVAGAEPMVEPDGSCGCNDDCPDCPDCTDPTEPTEPTTPTGPTGSTGPTEPTEPVQPCPDVYSTEDVQGTATRTISTLRYGGPYHYAQYYLVDGKPIKYNSPEYKAIIAKLKNGAMKETNGRRDRILLEEIDLGNGKVAKLVSDEQIAEIRKTQHPKGGGKDVRYTTITTQEGYTILYKEDCSGNRVEVERGSKAAMDAKRDNLNAQNN